MPQLDATVELEKLKGMYKEQAQNSRYNAIIYGPMGTGKSRLLRTCRPPIFVDSFDPGGTKTNRKMIEAGQMFADTRWELEDPSAPTVFPIWDKEYDRRKSEGFFSQIGTYALDSATTFAACIMNTILAKAKRAGTFPFQQDYGPAMAILENVIKDFTTLPCDVILICHEDVKKDEATGRMFIGPLFWGRLTGRVPLLFDEVYHAESKETSAGVKYSLCTKANGLVQARTRLGTDGIFEQNEDPDIMKLLRKAGMMK